MSMMVVAETVGTGVAGAAVGLFAAGTVNTVLDIAIGGTNKMNDKEYRIVGIASAVLAFVLSTWGVLVSGGLQSGLKGRVVINLGTTASISAVAYLAWSFKSIATQMGRM